MVVVKRETDTSHFRRSLQCIPCFITVTLRSWASRVVGGRGGKAAGRLGCFFCGVAWHGMAWPRGMAPSQARTFEHSRARGRIALSCSHRRCADTFSLCPLFFVTLPGSDFNVFLSLLSLLYMVQMYVQNYGKNCFLKNILLYI